MRHRIFMIVLLAWSMTAAALPTTDPRSIHLMGIPLEGPIDTLQQALQAAEFAQWGQSDDGEDTYFRGKFYGLRAKLMVSTDTSSRLVRSAYVTVGPYSTPTMLERNFQYFLQKMQQEYGPFVQRDEAWFYIDDFGSIKLSIVTNDNGSRDISVLFLSTAPYYKDALSMGLRNNVQEVVTENAVSEDQFMHFSEDGQLEQPDMVERQYDRYGYLVRALLQEQSGHSLVEFTYDDSYRLVRRTLTNEASGISYINDYTYNDRDEVLTQNQKVYDKDKSCVMTINMRNNYLTRDSNGNWTSNTLDLTYWEKGAQTQQATFLQRRTLTYWE